MKAQSAGAFELHFTSTARVGPLVGVHQLVGLEVGVLGEPFLANVALVRLLTRMESKMDLEVAQKSELFLANLALMRLLSFMKQQMILEVAQLSERLGAKVALVNKLPVFPFQRVRMWPDSAALGRSKRTAGTDGR